MNLVDLGRCLDPRLLCECFNDSIQWPGGIRAHRVRVKRFMPRSKDRFDFEFELTLRASDTGKPTSVRIFGRVPCLSEAPASPLTDTPHQSPASSTFSGDPKGSAPLRLTAAGITGLHTHLDDLDMTVHSMDCDPELPQFQDCLNAEDIAARLAQVAPDLQPSTFNFQLSTFGWRCETLAFRPQRRFVIRYLPTDHTAKHPGFIVKGFADQRGRILHLRQRLLAEHLQRSTGDRIRVPRPLHYDDQLKLSFTERTEHAPVAACENSAETLAWRSARAIAAIHSAPLDDLPSADPQGQLDVLQRWCRVIARLKPEIADRAHAILESLNALLPTLDTPSPAPIHGDFYESQIITGPQHSVTILDLDTLALGDPATDIGNFLAHQWLWCLQHGHDSTRYDAIVNATLEAYAAAERPINHANLAYYWAASLFRVGAIHTFRYATSSYASAMWDRVNPILRTCGVGLTRSAGAMPKPGAMPKRSAGMFPPPPPDRS